MVITAYTYPDYFNNFGSSSTLTLPSSMPILVSADLIIQEAVELTIDRIEQGKIVQLAMRRQKIAHGASSRRPLQLLPVQLRLFNLVDAHPLLNGMLRRPEIATCRARGDQIRDPGALLGKGLLVHGLGEPEAPEADHLHHPDADDGRLGILTPSLARDEAGRQRDDVLQRAAQRHTRHIGDDMHMEVRALEEAVEQLLVDAGVLVRHALQLRGGGGDLALALLVHDVAVIRGELLLRVEVHGRRVVADGGLAELLGGDLRGDVGAGQRPAVDAQLLHDELREERDPPVRDLDALDARDGARVRQVVALHLLERLVDELVRQVEDQDRGVFDGIAQVRVGDHVVRQRDPREVLDVLVDAVDDIRQLVCLVAEGLPVRRVVWDGHVLFENPHLHLFFEDIGMLARVFGEDFGDRRPPASSATAIVYKPSQTTSR